MPLGATIFIIRHAEVTGHEEDRGLSAFGHWRAYALIPYYYTRRGLPPPSMLIAAADQDNSMRPRVTLEPLASALNLRVEARYSEKCFRELAAKMHRAQRYNNAVTVIYWRHDQLMRLASALGQRVNSGGLCAWIMTRTRIAQHA